MLKKTFVVILAALVACSIGGCAKETTDDLKWDKNCPSQGFFIDSAYLSEGNTSETSLDVVEIIPATVAVAPSELSKCSGTYSAFGDVAYVNVLTPNGEEVTISAINRDLGTAMLHRDIRFVPVMENIPSDNDSEDSTNYREVKLISISFYDPKGNPLSVIESVESLISYVQHLEEKLEHNVANAAELSGTTNLSSLNMGAVYKYGVGEEISVLNDTGDIVEAVEVEWSDTWEEWRYSSDVLYGCSFPNDLFAESPKWYKFWITFGDSEEEQYKYVYFTEYINAQANIANTE